MPSNKEVMQQMWNEVPKYNLGTIYKSSDHGRLCLVLIPTSRGASMFYRRDWYLDGVKTSASKLLAMDTEVK